MLKIQQILTYEHIPKKFKSIARQRQANFGKVWLLENIISIKPSQVYAKVIDELNYSEIIYKFENHWRIRNAELSYQHPSDYITVNQPPESLPVYKLFIDLYYDDFGTF